MEKHYRGNQHSSKHFRGTAILRLKATPTAILLLYDLLLRKFSSSVPVFISGPQPRRPSLRPAWDGGSKEFHKQMSMLLLLMSLSVGFCFPEPIDGWEDEFHLNLKQTDTAVAEQNR